MKKTLLAASIGALSLLVAATAMAQVETDTSGLLGVRTVTAAPSGATTTLRAVTGAIDRCPMIESRVQMKIVDFDNNKIRHMEAYANMKERLAKVVEKLSGKGLDTSALMADLSVLETKVAKFSSDYAIYIGKLKDTQTAVCGKPKTQFLAKLKEAKAALVVVHQDALDIRAYYVSVIKPELQRLKTELSDLKASSSAPVVKGAPQVNPDQPVESPQTTEPSAPAAESATGTIE